MNPLKYCVAVLLLFSVSCLAQPARQIKLPLKLVTGYGPFQVGYSGLDFTKPPPDNPLYKAWAALQYNGIPSLKAVEKGIIWTDFLQFLYQNVQAGHLESQYYKQFRKESFITTDENDLSKKPIACYILFVKGIDKSGKEVLLIDTNHDANFADESPIIVARYLSYKSFEEHVKQSIQVSFQTVFKNKLISRTIPLLILKSDDEYLWSFPQHAIAELKLKNRTVQIAVSHDFFIPNYEIANIALLSRQKASKDAIARKTQYLQIDGQRYKNQGVHFASLSLLLEPVNNYGPTSEGAQKGMQAITFNGKDVLTNKEIKLNDFKGKYVFVDFWGSWCFPCVDQLEKLSAIYAGINKEKVAFIGIAGNDDLDRLRKMIIEKNIVWPNIFSDSSNLIVDKYNIEKYPTGLLIDPGGKIIATDVDTNNLETLLKEYLKN